MYVLSPSASATFWVTNVTKMNIMITMIVLVLAVLGVEMAVDVDSLGWVMGLVKAGGTV